MSANPKNQKPPAPAEESDDDEEYESEEEEMDEPPPVGKLPSQANKSVKSSANPQATPSAVNRQKTVKIAEEEKKDVKKPSAAKDKS